MITELKFILPLLVGFIIIAGILALILRAVLSSQSNLAIERLKRLNQDNLQREMELKKKLEETEVQYQRRIAEAAEEAEKIKGKIGDEATQMKNKIMAQVEKEKENILADARDEVEDLKRSFVHSMNEKVLGMTEQVIKKLFSLHQTNENARFINEIHSSFVEETLNQLKSLKKEVLSSALANSSEIELYSKLPLTTAQKQHIAKIFNEISQTPIQITEKPPQDELLAGVSLKIGNLIIDGSLKNKLRQILPEIKTELIR
jgi:F0F1-type ATP synthase delta subunit